MRVKNLMVFIAVILFTLSFPLIARADENPPKPSAVDIKGYVRNGEAGLEFSWPKNSQVSEYEYTVRMDPINNSDTKDPFLSGSTKEASVAIPLENNCKVIFRVRSCRQDGNTVSYSKWVKTVLKKSQVKVLIQEALSSYKPARPSDISVSGTQRGGQLGLIFKWKEAENADDYEYRCLVSQAGMKTSLRDQTWGSCSAFVAADAHSKVTFYVRAIRTVAGRTVRSGWEKKTLSGKKVDVLYSAASGQESGQQMDYTLSADEIRKYAAGIPENVLDAFLNLGFTVKVAPGKDYDGWFNIRKKAIEIRSTEDLDALYHEMGHFIAFASGNVDMTTSFQDIYHIEKSKYAWSNPRIAVRNASEYFAESVKEYLKNRSSFGKACPETADTVRKAIKSITPEQVKLLKNNFDL